MLANLVRPLVLPCTALGSCRFGLQRWPRTCLSSTRAARARTLVNARVTDIAKLAKRRSAIALGSFAVICSAAYVSVIAETGISPLSPSCAEPNEADGSEGNIAAGFRLSKSLQCRPRELLLRALWLFWSFLFVLLCSPAALVSPAFREEHFYGLVEAAIRYSRSAALTKWAQWASVRYDIFPVTLCKLLSQLQASAATHSLEHTLSELDRSGIRVSKDLGKDAPDAPGCNRNVGPVVHGFVEKPLASGAIAQVHEAHLDDVKVAIKVRHPSVDVEYILDFELLRRMATLLHSWVPPLRCFNAPATVTQFEAAMGQQCDLTVEASNLRKFNANFRRKRHSILFPKVFFATPAVLIESYEEGDLMSVFTQRWRQCEEMSMEARQQAHFVIQRGEDCYLQMLLVDNFVHADLHPGNILYRRSETGRQQIVLLDAGMATPLTSEERSGYIGLLQGLADGDADKIVRQVLSFSKQQQCKDVDGFRKEIRAMCAARCRGYGTNVRPGDVVREMMQHMYRYGVAIDGGYATMIVNVLCLEGLVKDLDMRFNIIDASYPLLRTHQLIGDERFQRIFSWSQWFVPEPILECFYRCTLYAGIHGDQVLKYRI